MLETLRTVCAVSVIQQLLHYLDLGIAFSVVDIFAEPDSDGGRFFALRLIA